MISYVSTSTGPVAATTTTATPYATGTVPTNTATIAPTTLTAPIYPPANPGTAVPLSPTNWLGNPVTIPAHHIMSPRDLPLSQKPIFAPGPFTTTQRNRFLKGTGAGLKISPHHRYQLPVSYGSVIDEIPGPGHPNGNQHTKGFPNRHPNKSIFNQSKAGKNLRHKEIRQHWIEKGKRLEERPPNSGKWFDPGP